MPFLADHQMQYFEMPAEEVVEPGAPEEETMKEESGPLEAVEIQE
jgi:hypothetical protein